MLRHIAYNLVSRIPCFIGAPFFKQPQLLTCPLLKFELVISFECPHTQLHNHLALPSFAFFALWITVKFPNFCPVKSTNTILYLVLSVRPQQYRASGWTYHLFGSYPSPVTLFYHNLQIIMKGYTFRHSSTLTSQKWERRIYANRCSLCACFHR